MATDEDGFTLVKRRGRHVGRSKTHKACTVQLEPVTNNLRADDIIARVQQYRYVMEYMVTDIQTSLSPVYPIIRRSIQKEQFYFEVLGMDTNRCKSYTQYHHTAHSLS